MKILVYLFKNDLKIFLPQAFDPLSRLEVYVEVIRHLRLLPPLTDGQLLQ